MNVPTAQATDGRESSRGPAVMDGARTIPRQAEGGLTT
jgi:hypothetical protein